MSHCKVGGPLVEYDHSPMSVAYPNVSFAITIFSVLCVTDMHVEPSACLSNIRL